jgi:hypothetical protein
MSELEDLNAKAARLWLEFMQAQAKAAASAAEKLPEMTRSLAETGVPLAAEVGRWMQGALAVPGRPEEVPPEQSNHEEQAPEPIKAGSAIDRPPAAPVLTRAKHRRLKMLKSMARRRARRA